MTPAWNAILALISTSVLVRIIPSFLNIKFSKKVELLIHEIIPFSVFINFIIYLLFYELSKDFYPALISMAIGFLCIYIFRLGLVVSTILTSLLYYYLIAFCQ